MSYVGIVFCECERVVRATTQVNGEAQNLTLPATPKPHSQATGDSHKIGRGDYVVGVYIYAKVRHGPLRGFVSTHVRLCASKVF